MIKIRPKFREVGITRESGFIPSQERYKLQAKVTLKEIKRTGREEKRASRLLLIPSALWARLSFNVEEQPASKEVIKLGCAEKIKTFERTEGEEVTFETDIQPRDVKEINQFRGNKALEAVIQLEGSAIPLYGEREELRAPPRVLDKISSRSDQLTITPTQFQKDFYERVKLGRKEIIEIQTKFPEIVREKYPPKLKETVETLEETFEALKKSRLELDTAETSSDYRKILENIEGPLDSLRKDVKTLGSYLYYETSTFKGGGAKQASDEMAEDLGKTINGIYQIASKPGHSTTRKQSLKMEYGPKEEDVRPIVIALSMVVQHILDKLEECFLRR